MGRRRELWVCSDISATLVQVKKFCTVSDYIKLCRRMHLEFVLTKQCNEKRLFSLHLRNVVNKAR